MSILAECDLENDKMMYPANRATTSFTLAGHSADFTPSVVQLASWGDRNLKILAQTWDRGSHQPCSTHWFYC